MDGTTVHTTHSKGLRTQRFIRTTRGIHRPGIRVEENSRLDTTTIVQSRALQSWTDCGTTRIIVHGYQPTASCYLPGFDLPGLVLLTVEHLFHINSFTLMFVQPQFNRPSKRQRKSQLPSEVQGGRKRHGSHRSPIIGQVKFNPSPVTKLNQPGVIWQ